MTNIEWTEKSWNPIVGCSIVSPGCTNCYAMKMAGRLEAMATADRPRWTKAHQNGQMLAHYIGTTKPSKAGAVWTGKVALAPDRALTEPLRRKNPTTWFVNSMGDLFHEDVPDEWIDRVFAVMALTPQHTYQVLTKRSGRMLAYMKDLPYRAASCKSYLVVDFNDHERVLGVINNRSWPLLNVWLGVSTERQQEADARIPDLLNTPAAVRFISAEPLLGPIDLTRIRKRDGNQINALDHGERFVESNVTLKIGNKVLSGNVTLKIGNKVLSGSAPAELFIGKPSLDWVIVGGESGPGARPMHPDWARSIRDQCAAAGAPMFFKQWGAWEIASDENGRRNGYSGHRMPDSGEKFTWLGYDGRTANPSANDVGEPAYAMAKVGKARAGRLLDGVEHNGMPSASSGEAAQAATRPGASAAPAEPHSGESA